MSTCEDQLSSKAQRGSPSRLNKVSFNDFFCISLLLPTPQSIYLSNNRSISCAKSVLFPAGDMKADIFFSVIRHSSPLCWQALIRFCRIVTQEDTLGHTGTYGDTLGHTGRQWDTLEPLSERMISTKYQNYDVSTLRKPLKQKIKN